MHRRQFLESSLGIAGLAAIAGCNSSATSSIRQPDRDAIKVVGGEEAIAILREPDKVEAFRLKDSEYHKTIDEYETVGDGVAVDNDTAAKLAGLFSDAGSFQLDSAKSCTPVYGVRIRFAKERDTLDLLFCFACDI